MLTESYLQHDKSIEWSKFLQAKFPTPFSTFQCSLKNPATNIACFPFYSLPFSFQTLQNSYDPTPVMSMKKIGHSLKNVKATCRLISSKCLIVLEKWGAWGCQFHIWTNFTNHFSIVFHFYIYIYIYTREMLRFKITRQQM